MAQTNLCFYSSGNPREVAQAYACYKWNADNGHTLTMKDLYGISVGDTTTYIGTLSSATYDSIYVFTALTGASGIINTSHKYDLMAKLKVASQGTTGATVSNATTATANSIGDSGETYVVDAEIGNHVVINGGTGASQVAYITDNTTTVMLITETFAVTPSTDSDYAIITDLAIYHPTASTATTGADMAICWAYFYDTRPMPYVFHVFSNKYGVGSTSTAISSSSLTNSGAPWTIDAEIGKYVQIYSGTTNGYQYAKITDNTTTVLTVSGWINVNSKGAPTGNFSYKVLENLGEVFHDEYISCYIKAYLFDLTDGVILDTWKKMVDLNDGATTRPTGYPLVQDIDFILDTVIPTGKTIFAYLYNRT